MSAPPPKPWERTAVNYQNSGSLFNNNMASSPMETVFNSDAGDRPLPSVQNRNPPPLPARPTQSSLGSPSSPYYGNYGSYGNSYGYSSPYSSMYSPYSGSTLYGSNMYGYGMNRYSQLPNTGSTFARQAEESSRQAFQSVESIVQAFGSVAAMLESTYSAVFNSFRAVLGVADQFSRMRQHFAHIFSALAVVKMLRWLVHKLLVFLRLRNGTLTEDVWKEAVGSVVMANSDSNGSVGGVNWPIFLFFAVIIGGPWLIWRLLSSVASSKGDGWANGDDDHFVAVADFDFESAQEDELSFQRGQTIIVAPKELQPKMRGWLLACVDGQKIGIVPANYVRVMGKRRGRKSVAVVINQKEQLAITSQKVTESGSENMPTLSPQTLEQTYAEVNVEQFNSNNPLTANVSDRTAGEILDQSEKHVMNS